MRASSTDALSIKDGSFSVDARGGSGDASALSLGRSLQEQEQGQGVRGGQSVICIDPRVETLAAEILHQRTMMLNAERRLQKKKHLSPSRNSRDKGKKLDTHSLSGLADIDNESVGSVDSVGSKSQMSAISLGSLTTPSHMRDNRNGGGGGSGRGSGGAILAHSPVKTVKNQSMQDALHERVFIGKGPSTFVGPASYERRWKGPGRVKHSYERSIF